MLGIAYLCKGLALPQSPSGEQRDGAKGTALLASYSLSGDEPASGKGSRGAVGIGSPITLGMDVPSPAVPPLSHSRGDARSCGGCSPRSSGVGPGPAGSAAQPRGRCGAAGGGSRRGCRSGPGDPLPFYHWRAATS